MFYLMYLSPAIRYDEGGNFPIKPTGNEWFYASGPFTVYPFVAGSILQSWLKTYFGGWRVGIWRCNLLGTECSVEYVFSA